MRYDEEFAKEAFSRFLRRQGAMDVLWCAGTEPPDYFMHVGEEKFEVEVTQVMESVELGMGKIPSQGVKQALKSFARELEEGMKLRGLQGTYVLDLGPIPSLSQQRETLLRACIDYVVRTSRDETQEPEALFWDSHGPQLQIKKSSSRGASICELIGPASPKSEGHIVGEASRIIQEAIARKTAKCKLLKGRVVLLLIDAYMYAGADVWQATVNWLPRSAFHTIARVHSDYQCQVLHSIDSQWLTTN